MPQATITIAGITPPGVGKKQGKIADSAGGVWNIWGDKMAPLQMGAMYNIDYTNEEFNGRGFTLIKSITTAGNGQAMPLPLGQPMQQVVQPQRQTTAIQPPQPQAVASTVKDEQIHLCGAVNNMLANPNVVPSELNQVAYDNFVDMILTSWRRVYGGRPIPQRNPPPQTQAHPQNADEMQDSIPF